MKKLSYMTKVIVPVGIAGLFVIFFLFQSGCKKKLPDNNSTPTKFTELKVDPNFEFQNFKEVQATITVPALKQSGTSIIRIYQGNPATGGKLISAGSLDNNNQFQSPIRLPSRLTEVFVAKLASNGMNEYVAAPIVNGSIVVSFGQKSGTKEGDGISSNDCNTGCTQTVSGTKYNFTINSGQVVCVDEGTNAVFSSLKINTGGTLRICGTATVNSYNSTGGEGAIAVTPTGSLILPKYNTYFTIENYGILKWTGNGDTKQYGTLHNYGTVNSTNKFQNEGTIINDGTFTVTNYFTNNTASVFTNNCSFYATSNKNNSWSNNGTFTNNGYVSVSGTANVSGSATLNLGLQSLVETKYFNIQGEVNGPTAQGSQIHALGSSSSNISSSSQVSGFVDFWASSINPNNGSYGPNVTFHNPGYTIPVPSCSLPVAPTITSSLVGGGLVNEPIIPYVVTATGTEPITYNATNLPPGLSYNPTTHTISGTPTAAGVYNITLTADNFMGTDTKTLVFTITQPTAPPVITSSLTASTPVNQSFTYTVTASGTGPITYNASNLPTGLIFDPVTNQIIGTPTSPGVYNIPLSASNGSGTDNKTLILTVGAPPVITSPLTANGTMGTQFPTYTLTATGSGPISYLAVNLPEGLTFNANNNTINGVPTHADITDVTITATNSFGSDVETLIVTIVAGIQPPEITSPLTDAVEINQPYSYEITADGTDPITFNATALPPGLTRTGEIISGIPTATGIFNIPITATNGAGSDQKTLVLTILAAGSTTDTDGDGIMDNIDEYPTDPTRAFNSYYPNQVDFGTFAFEDLWPAYGDYDCNDLVLNFHYKIVTNAQNNIVDLIMRYQVMAVGASLNNGLGISLSTNPSNVEGITGCIILGNALNLDPVGYEIGHTNKTVFFPIDAVNTFLGNGMVNTIPGGNTAQTSVDTVTVHFSTPQASIGTPPYNPFIFVNQERGHEVHLKDQPPTDLVNPEYFDTMDDASVPGEGLYYRSQSGLCWAFEIPVSFEWPIESVDILKAYLHFAEWAESSGVSYPGWYLDEPGYIDQEFIY